jgi:hypothetical protein
MALAEMVLGEVKAKEDLTLRLGDSLDVKASIGLALILFLATQTAYYFDKGLPYYGACLQKLSIVCIVLAALFAVAELWPRKFFLPDPESDYVTRRIAELTEHYSQYPDADSNIAGEFAKETAQWTKVRIADNQKKNKVKSALLNWSFGFTLVAVILNLLTLLLIARIV